MDNPKILVIITILLWSIAATLARLVSMGSIYLLLTLIFSFTFLIQFVFTFIQNKHAFLQTLKNVEPKFLLFGLFGYGIYWLGFVKSAQAYNHASEPTILNYTWPIFTILFTELLFRKSKEKKKKVYLVETVGVLAGFLSVLILVTKGDILSFQVTNIPGLLFGLVAGISYGFFSAFSSTVPKEKQSIFLLASVFSSLLLMGSLLTLHVSQLETISLKDLIIAGLLGCVVDGFGYIAWTRANRVAKEKNISISSIASLTFLIPVLSLIIITIVFKESSLFQPYFLLTLLLLLTSYVLCQKAELIAAKV